MNFIRFVRIELCIRREHKHEIIHSWNWVSLDHRYLTENTLDEDRIGSRICDASKYFSLIPQSIPRLCINSCPTSRVICIHFDLKKKKKEINPIFISRIMHNGNDFYRRINLTVWFIVTHQIGTVTRKSIRRIFYREIHLTENSSFNRIITIQSIIQRDNKMCLMKRNPRTFRIFS